MKKILVIGSAVADVIIRLEDHLPVRGEDVHVLSQTMRLGGCAFNVYDMIRHFQLPSIPFFPVGKGAYGDFIREELRKRNIRTPVPTPQADNGCCYCFIEADGERSFISYHGAEYRFYPEWFSVLREEEIDSVYICGLEIEEPTGPAIVGFLEQYREQDPDLAVFFAPGPRLLKISPDLTERIFALHPILHLNDTEAVSFTEAPSLSEAAAELFRRTGNTVLVTLGGEGCLVCSLDEELEMRQTVIPGVPARQIDTIGAGDAHIGAVIAALYKDFPMEEAVRLANYIASAVVTKEGALLDDAAFAGALRQFMQEEM